MEDERTVSDDRETVSLSRDGRSAEPEHSILLLAFVGAGVTVVTAPLLPFAAIVGGGVAGYLRRSDLAEGAKVGALAGVAASIPAFIVVWLFVGIVLLGADPLMALSSLFALLIFLVVTAYTVGASALGGAAGAYLQKEL
ncbi:DUF5518 domain-containing protein [Halorussus litoreus]|uniref:DUF5518 domain-containing protein n=1 Tax=Halorussus litoreus TaxID=1710536 RepID=UPI000E26B2B8|nr:DUF5518 domain-containing protein [Halorussus litoreus]